MKECIKFIEIEAFRKLTSLKRSSDLFQFYLLYFVFNVKCDRRHKVRCTAGSNRADTFRIDISATTAQNTTVSFLLLVPVWQKHNVIIADAENVCLNAIIIEKVHTKLGNKFSELVRIICSLCSLASSDRYF